MRCFVCCVCGRLVLVLIVAISGVVELLNSVGDFISFDGIYCCFS